ncbi:hypothetical protein A8F94_13690 [Bacillus sp. FJAT-27225]|uniref:Hsp20/alpha crystallin family protein n=1 Tax=Bacillus sp. FJAT-27225 TaxID=1743144 RepID=UPI00080C25E2|nr:Hsp20/alpha crystallin family protein [Bacillus sp. FJAT-27225]OCA85899.1 hypothetical protein A8F94_13690 [Bacillus sp. FJAT-27225]
MRKKGHRSRIEKTLGSDFMELLAEVAPLIGPRIDFFHTVDTFYIIADLAGVKSQDVKLDMIDGSMIISGVIHPLFDELDCKLLRQERFYGPFKKKIPLPKNCLPEQMTAKLENGIVKISIPFYIQKSDSPQGGSR